MMNLRLTLLLILFMPLASDCQTMETLFKLLPAECTPDLTVGKRAKFFKEKTYIVPGGDSIETTEYNIEDVSKDHLAYGLTFTTGQNGFVFFELRKFKKTDGTILLVFSRYGGLLRSFSQQELKIFYLRSNKLVEDTKQKLLPQTISINGFLKTDSPDSIRSKAEECLNGSYNLKNETTNEIEFTYFSQCLAEDEEQWLSTNAYRFTWTGNKFIRKPVPEN